MSAHRSLRVPTSTGERYIMTREINLLTISKAYDALPKAQAAYKDAIDPDRYMPMSQEAKDRRTEDLYAAYEAWQNASAILTDAIDAAEGRSTERTITAYDVIESLRSVENSLNIPKKHLEGVSVTIDVNAQRFPKAYRYTPESTIFSATWRKGSWRVTDIYRGECRSPDHTFRR